MTDKDFSFLNDEEFDRMLEEIPMPAPSEEMVHQVNPWRKAMNRVLWGLGLVTITLNFFQLQYILPAIGLILMVLGYRALRRENRWFMTAYILTILRTVWFLFNFFMDTTIFGSEISASTPVVVGLYGMLVLNFVEILCLRNGMGAVQRKAGLEPKTGSATAMLCWYAIMVLLGLVNFSGVSVLLLLAAYFFILRGLHKSSKLLDEAGYIVQPAPLGFSDRAVKIAYTAVIVVLFVIGYSFFGKYPMNWQVSESIHTEQAEQIRRELLELGFPERVLDDLTVEEILACEGATTVLVDGRDYDMDQGRGIGTQEEINNGLVALITADQGEAHLRTTYVGVKFGDERERWKIIQHFEWLSGDGFCGTEAIQLWPGDHSHGWGLGSDITGRVLYDQEGQTWESPYHFLGRASYANDPWLASMFGESTATDVFAAFSMPNEGSRHRGYVTFELLEMQDGYLVDCWLNYSHQKGRFQFPVRTAMEDITAGFGSREHVFTEIQTALQFSTHGEAPKLLN